MKLLTCLFCLLIASCSVIAEQTKSSGVSPSINRIETHRVNGHVVRIIKHNMELDPRLELEILLPPDMKTKDYLNITSVKTPDREYLFKKSDGVFVEAIKVTETSIEITFEYYMPKAEAITLNCKIFVSDTGFDSAACTKS